MKRKKIALWVLSIFMFIMAFGTFELSPVSGILVLLVAVGCNPFFLSVLSKTGKKPKNIILVPVLVVLFLIGMYFVPTEETKDTGETVKQGEQWIEGTEELAAAEAEDPTVTEEVIVVQESLTVEEAETESEEPTEKAVSELSVHFMDVGQGDSVLLICGEDAMLIDAGNNGQGTKIQKYLQKQGIENLKYVIGTHADADHIGGMDVILYKFDCETVIMTDEVKDTNTYRDVVDTMSNKGYKNTLPVVGDTYSFGDAEFTIVGPSKIDDDSNNNSVAILLTHGENRFLFTGDAGEEEETDIINSGISLNADVYKVGHHGSKYSSTKNLLDAVSPTYAVISCAEENPYGHPHAETLNNLRAMGVQVFRTDEQGSIIATSDGKEITWNCSPSETWKAGEAAQSSPDTGQKTAAGNPSVEQAGEQTAVETPVEVPAAVTYICNTNTGKFHYPSCSSVKQMSEKNKLAVTGSREEVVNQGYVPCKRCNP